MKLRDLKRGMRCTYRNGTVIQIENVQGDNIDYMYPAKTGAMCCDWFNDDLSHPIDDLDIMKVEDLSPDGYKTVWERVEQKYYLKLPNANYADSQYLNLDTYYNAYDFDSKSGYPDVKTQFTLVEIKDLPNQDFINSLIKEEVK